MLASAIAFVACTVGDLDAADKGCPCAAGWSCDTSRNVCVRPGDIPVAGQPDAGGDGAEPCVGEGCLCQTSRDCLDPTYNRCVAGKCAECTTLPDTCPANKYCLAPFNECAPGCKLDTECAALGGPLKFCNVQRHQCVECLADGDCTGGKKCSPSGACVDTCTGTCATGTCCNGLCLDTTKDIGNCGGCGVACAGTKTQCCAGKCADPLTDAANCGACGTVCSNVNATPGCQAGSCKPTCNAGYLHCATGNTGCETNGTNDVLHCGSCTRNCNTVVVYASGISCAQSACNYTSCQTGHFDLDGNRGNGCESTSVTCGGNNQPCCQPGNTCNPGQLCEPPPAGDGKCH